MMPKIIKKQTMLIAGVAGSGDETAKAWETFRQIQKTHPLKNQAEDVGYEVRLYSGEGMGIIHIGVPVKDAKVPPEYKVFTLPAGTYAEFEIYPAKGYGSSNTGINNWLEENSSTYKEASLNGMHYAVEVYDKRYKGDKDPKSIVGILVAIEEMRAESKKS